ncbi:MAG: hypothetical protein AAF702_12200 [Chloroflexota bacterium]
MAEAVEESVTEGEGVNDAATETTAEATEGDLVDADAGSEPVEEEGEEIAEDAVGPEADASSAEPPQEEEELPPLEPIQFRGVQKNPTIAIALTLAGVMAFSMGMTKTFYADATAWSFVIWGVLLLFSDMLDNYQTYELNNEGIYINNPIRFWYRNKSWKWSDIYRIDVLVGRRDSQPEDADMHVYHVLEGELIKDREDRKLDPAMAQIIIERAELQAVDEDNPPSVAQLPLNQRATYHWTRSGSLA